MNRTEPSVDELAAAYQRSRLRWIGVSYQTAITNPNMRIALRNLAIALRNKKQQPVVN